MQQNAQARIGKRLLPELALDLHRMREIAQCQLTLGQFDQLHP
jgi:hypothetical protein